MKARCSETIMSPRGRRCDATKFIDINLIKEHLAMETILAIDLGKRNRKIKGVRSLFGGLGNLGFCVFMYIVIDFV